MKKQRFPKHIIYALISLASPITILFATLAYQSAANSSFWHSITPEESGAGAMMAFAEVAQLIFLSMVGCLLGLIFAVLSIRLQRRVLGVGLAALVFNGLPFLLLASLWIKGMARGL